MVVYAANGGKSITRSVVHLFPFLGGNWNRLEGFKFLPMIRLHHLTHQTVFHIVLNVFAHALPPIPLLDQIRRPMYTKMAFGGLVVT